MSLRLALRAQGEGDIDGRTALPAQDVDLQGLGLAVERALAGLFPAERRQGVIIKIAHVFGVDAAGGIGRDDAAQRRVEHRRLVLLLGEAIGHRQIGDGGKILDGPCRRTQAQRENDGNQQSAHDRSLSDRKRPLARLNAAWKGADRRAPICHPGNRGDMREDGRRYAARHSPSRVKSSCTSWIAPRNATTLSSISALLMVSGGDSTIQLPSGRIIRPRSRQRSNTRLATLQSDGQGVFAVLSATHSTQTMKWLPRTSPTRSRSPSVPSWSRKYGPHSRTWPQISSRSRMSSAARPAAHATGCEE